MVLVGGKSEKREQGEDEGEREGAQREQEAQRGVVQMAIQC